MDCENNESTGATAEDAPEIFEEAEEQNCLYSGQVEATDRITEEQSEKQKQLLNLPDLPASDIAEIGCCNVSSKVGIVAPDKGGIEDTPGAALTKGLTRKEKLIVYFKRQFWIDLLLSVVVAMSYHVVSTWPHWPNLIIGGYSSTARNLGFYSPSKVRILYPSATVELQSLAEEERHCYEILHQCWDKHVNLTDNGYHGGKFLGLIYQYLQDYETSSGRLYEKDNVAAAELIAGNPLASFRMLDRFVTLLDPMRGEQFPCSEYYYFSKELANKLRWPEEEDLLENIVRILRLQQIYNLSTEDIAQGRLEKTDTNITLSTWQKYQMGLVALKHRYYTYAYQWLQLTLKGMGGNGADGTPIQQRARETLNLVIEEHDNSWNNTLDARTEYHFHLPLSVLEVPEPRVARRDILAKHTNNWVVNYWKLCSGQILSSLEKQSKLFCWLETQVHPFWIINPLKLELLSLNPDVVRAYEVIGDNLIEKVISEGLPIMDVSRVVNRSDPTLNQVSDIRTSLQAWVDDLSKPDLKAMSKKVEMVMGLKTMARRSSEKLQILAYSFGGHYAPHVDCLRNPQRYGAESGDRIATFMFYLSDVQAGGNTVFTSAGVVAEPIKGSAVFWFSLYKDGECDDPVSQHGGCPVLLGQKFASNKWVRYYDQFQISKCGLTPKELQKVKVNGLVIP